MERNLRFRSTMATTSVRLRLSSVLAQVEGAQIIGPLNPLCVTIAEVHARAGGPVIIFGIRPVVMRAAQAAAGIIVSIQEKHNL